MLEAYAMVLAQRNMTIAECEADVRRQILIHRVVDVAIEGSVVSDLEIEQTYKARDGYVYVVHFRQFSCCSLHTPLNFSAG